jgi:hypothetical protein
MTSDEREQRRILREEIDALQARVVIARREIRVLTNQLDERVNELERIERADAVAAENQP